MNEESIFAAALTKHSAAERAAYLDEACAGNAALRAQVDELLQASDDAGSFLNHAPVSSGGTDATVAATRATDDTEKSAEWTGALSFLEPCDAPGRIGKLGHYEIIEVFGRGGMGAVLRAYDTRLSRVVAVKVMAPELAANPTAVKRFLREAKMAAAVHHDHVVTIHEIQGEHRPPYLVMQFIEGQTLAQKIEREGALELTHILRIGGQIAAGLAAAHKQGLVHRDVKPANILLENGVERVKITDFGLARAADDVEVTQAGLIAGTPQYMSPEQAKGETIDMRSDLFSLGSVLYTMCTGRAAFRAETTMGVLKRVCEDAPRPIHEVNPEIPDWLAAIVLKLLAKNPADRFQTAAEVAELFSQHLAHVQSPTLVPRPATVVIPASLAPPPKHLVELAAMAPAHPANSGAGVTLVVVLGLCLLALAPIVLIAIGLVIPWTLAKRSAPRQDMTNFGTVREAGQIVEGPTEMAKLPSMDLNQWGKLLDPTDNCTVERRPDMAIFHVPGDVPYNLIPGLPLGMNAPRMLREAQGDFAIQIRVLPFAKALPATSTAGPETASWRSAGLVVIGGEETVIRLERVSWGERKGGAPMMHLECFHKGQRIADHYGSITDDERSTLFRLERRGNVILGSYSDDGSRWETYRLDKPPLPDQVLVGLAAVHTTPTTFDPAFEDLRFQSGDEARAAREVAAAGSPAQPLVPADTLAAAPRVPGWGASWSPNGKLLVRNRRLTDELEIIDLDTRQTTLLYQGGADPAWSPKEDGPIAFVLGTQLNDATKEELWLIEADGTNPRKLCDGGYPSWSRDGSRLYYRHASGTLRQVRSIDPTKPELEPAVHALSEGASSYPAISPDGTMVAYGIGTRLVVHMLNESNLVASVDLPGWNGILTCWSPDSRFVTFGSFGWSDNCGAWILDTKTGQSRMLAAGSLTLPRWSPDGSRIAVDDRSKSEMVILDLADLHLENGLPQAGPLGASGAAEFASRPAGSSAEILTSGKWEWTTPENLGPTINSDENDGGPALSADGLSLLFHSTRAGGQGQKDLWISTRSSLESPWKEPENLGPMVNSEYQDHDACLSADGLMMVFTSNRPGGYGSHDVWMSTRTGMEQPWSAAVNLGSLVNSGSVDEAPTLAADGLTLIFNSDRSGRHGMSDLWICIRLSPTAPWSSPRNLGPQLNSLASQGYSMLAADGLALVFNSNRTGGPWSGPLWISTRGSTAQQWPAPVRLWNDTLGAWSCCLSADAQTMLFDSKRDGGRGELDIWMSRRVRKNGQSETDGAPP